MTIKKLQERLMQDPRIKCNISENEILLLLKRLPSNSTDDDLWSALRDLNLKSGSFIKSDNDDILKMILDFKKKMDIKIGKLKINIRDFIGKISLRLNFFNITKSTTNHIINHNNGITRHDLFKEKAKNLSAILTAYSADLSNTAVITSFNDCENAYKDARNDSSYNANDSDYQTFVRSAIAFYDFHVKKAKKDNKSDIPYFERLVEYEQELKKYS